MLSEIRKYLKETEKSNAEKKEVLINLIKQANKEEILDIAYELGQCGYYQEDKRKSKKLWILDIIDNIYNTNDNLSVYQGRNNMEIENAIMNKLHIRRIILFLLNVYYQ